ncbi:PREDICTED: uncharacterized protein LOC104590397 isoform X2 [Nelumbo nucifera]|uniref:Uncharacterized protein LOC104590397 isoform X2 n=1 Tax=Nelumbo nucifera TaxID=4432 RepID=A0A1U7Z510_NELNU|nr:PREDICTED: uncharacterized protein LOC104590397 isoform X2 [Nelumbo nucifera]
MATSSKFRLSSGSPDRPSYPTGQRGAYGSSLDKSGNFHESMENRIPPALPSMSRSGSSVTQFDIINFFQCLHLDTKLMAVDHRFPRQFELKRILVAATASSDSPSISLSSKVAAIEDLKRAKIILNETSMRARDRGRNLNDAISKFGKFFQSTLVRKRTRADASSSDRPNASIPSERPVLGGSMANMGSHSHMISKPFDVEPQKLEEKLKNGLPNKRVRTSMVDANTLGVPSGAMDRDREMFRAANCSAVPSEEKGQALAIGVDGWEKPKMRKKRSGIKSDVCASTMLTRPLDGDRESKCGMQQRHVTDARTRLIRPSAGGIGKFDMSSQQNGLGMRSSTPRIDQDNGSAVNDRRDRPVGSDKERVNLKAVNRPISREDTICSVSPTSTIKVNTSARAQRFSSSTIPKSSPSAHKVGSSDDYQLSQCMNKVQDVAGSNSRKHTPPTPSSSPPVTQWAGQRPQKISRMARRTNFVHPMSSQDDNLASDIVSHVAGTENGFGVPRCLSSKAHQQVKLKGEHLSSVALPEIEESGAAEIKSKDKCKKSCNMNEKVGQSIQRVASLVFSSRKNKISADEDLGDGVRRLGRSGRGFTSTRSGMPTTMDKLNNVATAKQLRSARLGLDKGESKAGRPATRKPSNYKAYTRPKHAMNSGIADILEPGDGHKELLAAANAAITPTHACSNSFWMQMEQVFGFISDEDIAYLKQQICLVDEPLENIDVKCCSTTNLKGNVGSNSLLPMVGASGRDDCSTVPIRNGLVDSNRNLEIASKGKDAEFFDEHLVPGIRVHNTVPLAQRLIAALIPEEDNNEFFPECDEDVKFDICGTGFELPTSGLKSNSLNHLTLESFLTVGQTASNAYRTTSSWRVLDEIEHDELENDGVVADANTGMNSNFVYSLNGFHPDQSVIATMACTESQYDQLSIDERILLELQSIGILPEALPDLEQSEDEEINEEISGLREKLQEQVLKKRRLLCNLEKSVTEARESQQREIELNAVNKLVEIAYENYMTYCAPNISSGKSANSKWAKRATLAFVRRTLERCHKFEDTGESCFNGPLFRDLFLSVSSCHNESECLDTTITEGESASTDISTRSLDARVSASMNSHQTAPVISRSGQNIDMPEKHSSNAFHLVNHLSEPTTGKEGNWSNRAKKKELLLDDVVGGTIGTSLRNISGFGGSLLSGTKGKRSERDREGKGHKREVLSRNCTPKIGRPALGNVKGERKSKTKPKQKTTQLSASVKAMPPPVPKSRKVANDGNMNGKDVLSLDMLNDTEAIDLSSLQLPGMDVLGVPDDLDGQGQDLSSWLNIDDDGLQDHDCMGLEIPMDDLSELNMMV